MLSLLEEASVVDNPSSNRLTSSHLVERIARRKAPDGLVVPLRLANEVKQVIVKPRSLLRRRGRGRSERLGALAREVVRPWRSCGGDAGPGDALGAARRLSETDLPRSEGWRTSSAMISPPPPGLPSAAHSFTGAPTPSVSNGWDESAEAWIAELGDLGDFGRRFVLDQPMMERVRLRTHATALDVGCGEGRFCRMLQPLGIHTVGLDPTEALLARASALDPTGEYRVGVAERLELDDQSFDLVVSYLSLIDIAQLDTALREIARVLRPGGSLLIANLTGFTTAGMVFGGRRPRGADRHAGYLDEHSSEVRWGDIRIRNWHRPLETYMKSLLEAGLQLGHFSEPRPHGGPPEKVRRYLKAPYFLIMEWTKPTA